MEYKYLEGYENSKSFFSKNSIQNWINSLAQAKEDEQVVFIANIVLFNYYRSINDEFNQNAILSKINPLSKQMFYSLAQEESGNQFNDPVKRFLEEKLGNQKFMNRFATVIRESTSNKDEKDNILDFIEEKIIDVNFGRSATKKENKIQPTNGITALKDYENSKSSFFSKNRTAQYWVNNLKQVKNDEQQVEFMVNIALFRYYRSINDMFNQNVILNKITPLSKQMFHSLAQGGSVHQFNEPMRKFFEEKFGEKEFKNKFATLVRKTTQGTNEEQNVLNFIKKAIGVTFNLNLNTEVAKNTELGMNTQSKMGVSIIKFQQEFLELANKKDSKLDNNWKEYMQKIYNPIAMFCINPTKNVQANLPVPYITPEQAIDALSRMEFNDYFKEGKRALLKQEFINDATQRSSLWIDYNTRSDANSVFLDDFIANLILDYREDKGENEIQSQSVML